MNRKIANPSAVSSGIFFTGSVDITINAHTNNLSTSIDNFVVIRLTPTANYNLTGLVPPDISLGWYVLMYNVGTGNSITLKNNDALSTSTNRFLLGADKNLQGDEGIALVYDVVSQRWRSFGINI
jgi:hypothetical protein